MARRYVLNDGSGLYLSRIVPGGHSNGQDAVMFTPIVENAMAFESRAQLEEFMTRLSPDNREKLDLHHLVPTEVDL